MDRHYSHYVYLSVAAILVILAAFIAKSFLAAIVLGAIFAYWFSPIHNKLSKKIRELPSAIIIAVTLFATVVTVVQYGLYLLLRELSKIAVYIDRLEVGAAVSSFFGTELTKALTMKSMGHKIITSMTNDLSDIIYTLPSAVISLFVFIMVFFYLLKDGDRVYKWLKYNIPFPKDKRHQFVDSIKNYVDAFLKSELLVALAQGIVCAIGFYIFGLSDYILLGAIAATLFSVLPVIGPYLLYVPIGVILALRGNAATGIGLLIYGLSIGSLLDYIVRPNLTGKYAKMHPILVLVGILGGFNVFGVAGIFVGPIVLGICITLIEALGERSR